MYADRAGGTVTEWRDRMRAETWYSAEDAVAAGLADEVVNKCGKDEKSNAASALPQLNLAALIRDAAREPEPIITADLFGTAVRMAHESAPASNHKPPAPAGTGTGIDFSILAQHCVEGATL
jgi:hypothetical protein